jgi:hypothetical protein
MAVLLAPCTLLMVVISIGICCCIAVSFDSEFIRNGESSAKKRPLFFLEEKNILG